MISIYIFMQSFKTVQNYIKLVVPIQHTILRSLSYKTLNKVYFETNTFDVYIRDMSQRSITSFFKITPKKIDTEVEAEVDNERVKRSRSSSTDSEETKSSPSPVKKRKIKRTCIESSDSESENINKNNKKDETNLPNEKEKIEVKQEILTPNKKPPKQGEKVDDVQEKKDVKSEKLSPKTPRVYKKKESKQKLEKRKESFVEIKTEEPQEIKKSLGEENNEFKTKSLKDKKLDSSKKETQKENGHEKIPNEGSNEIKKAEDYDPSKSKYHPIDDACWKKGEEIPYLVLAKTLELIEQTSARLKMVEILSNYFRSVIALTPEDLLPSVYLCLNQLAPAYHNLELGIAETYLMKAVGSSTGRTLAQMKAASQRLGDLGRAAEEARTRQRVMFPAPPLRVRGVYRALREVAAFTGQASVNKKISKIQTLYVACRQSEARYLIRSLEGKLRVGLAEQSLLQALALACAKTPPDDREMLDKSSKMSADDFKARVDEYALIIKTTYCECPNYDMIIPVLLEHGVEELPKYCRLTAGVPLKPMLAHPTKGVSEVFDRFEGEEFTCEWKYDGERAQIHVPGDEKPNLSDASIFSRNQENNTTKYPDIITRLPSLLKDTVQSCVLDCEAVAFDTETKQILPFQVLSTRKRKDVEQNEIKVQVCVFVFDLLFLNGRALVREPLFERRRLLKEHFNEVEGQWQFAAGRDCKNTEEVETLLDEAIRGSCEGLMVKALRGPRSSYDIARRSRNWLKLKKDYLEGVGDTIDAVVIGGYRGRGKRAGVYGGFLLACYDPATEQYQSLCKIGTGFSDEDLKTLSAELDKHVIDAPRNYYSFEASLAADAWFAAHCVWEVRCADLSLSPAHRAAVGLADPDRGVSLRFPRFVRVRDDKTPESATTAQQIAELYSSQDQVKNTAPKHVDHDDFY